MPKIIAVADIGSNTAHMLVASVSKAGFSRLTNLTEWLSLGERVARDGVIAPDLEAQLISTLEEFKTIAESYNAKTLKVIATEAMRMSQNHELVIGRIKKQTKIEVELISPRTEAELGLTGALVDCQCELPLLFLEIGGGSMQVAYFDANGIGQEVSLPLGTGRLKVGLELDLPPDAAQFQRLNHHIEAKLAVINSWPKVKSVIASGGVARGVLRALHADGDRVLLDRELAYMQWSAQQQTPAILAQRFYVKERRASTLLVGTTLLRHVLRVVGKRSVMVSEYGVREGIILQLFNS